MIASSAARSSVSVSSRLVSSNRRAFSSATLRLAAIVVEQLDVRVAEGVLAVEVLQRDHAARPVADDERHPDSTTSAARPGRSPFDAVLGRARRHRSSIDGSACRSRSTMPRIVPGSAAARPGSGRRARSCTGSGHLPASRSTIPMSTTWASKISWILSPTSSYIACMSSSAARPCWTPLMIASSAARWSVSAEQALRLVEQARVLEGDAHARGDVAQQPLVGVAEGVRARRLSRAMTPSDAVAGQDRDAEPGLRSSDADRMDPTPAAVLGCVPTRSGCARSDDRDVRPRPIWHRSGELGARLRRCSYGKLIGPSLASS